MPRFSLKKEHQHGLGNDQIVEEMIANLKNYNNNKRETTLAIIGFLILLALFVYRDIIRVQYIKANSEFKILNGAVAEYYNKASRSRGVIIHYYLLEQKYKTPCTTKLCQNLVIGDSVILKAYLDDPEIIDVQKMK